MSVSESRIANWHRSLAEAIRDVPQLLHELQLTGHPDLPPTAESAFPLLVPRSYVRRMEPGNPADPLLRQVLPVASENDVVSGFQSDAVDDAAARKTAGLLQKYPGRALLIAAGSCAVHCRYCFRREYPYGDEPRTVAQWRPALEALSNDPGIHEVILSGGDPLMLSDLRLSELVARLDAIPHLNRLRIHSRLPIVLPDRVNQELIELLQSVRMTPIVVVHANHPREIAGDCAAALSTLVRSGVTVLNQAVLLRGVNDTADVQIGLSERLINLGVIPYYLHQLDRVTGTAHFEVSDDVGRTIVDEIRRMLPGYAVPQFVREIPGSESKTPL